MKFPIFTAIAIMMLGLFFFLYIMFNYAFFNPTSGAFTLIDAQRSTMMGSGDYYNWAQDILDFQHSWWGTCFVVLCVMVVIGALVDVIRSPRQSIE